MKKHLRTVCLDLKRHDKLVLAEIVLGNNTYKKILSSDDVNLHYVTVHHSIKKLEQLGLIASKINIHNVPEKIYFLTKNK